MTFFLTFQPVYLSALCETLFNFLLAFASEHLFWLKKNHAFSWSWLSCQVLKHLPGLITCSPHWVSKHIVSRSFSPFVYSLRAWNKSMKWFLLWASLATVQILSKPHSIATHIQSYFKHIFCRQGTPTS